MKKKDIDICIVTYNRLEQLQNLLKSLSKQTNQNFNLFISDDGSSEELLNPNNFPIISKYTWYKKRGYQRTLRVNELMDVCISPNILVLNDDCIPTSKYFVDEHVKLIEKSDVVNEKVRIGKKVAPFLWGGCNFSIKKRNNR